MGSDPENLLQCIADACGGKITEVGDLGDGSGFATMSLPLREDHWIYDRGPRNFNAPPMPFRMGGRQFALWAIADKLPPEGGRSSVPIHTLSKRELAYAIREAGKYAVRASTMNGREMDFDPDAMLQNLVVGFLGYWTDNGLTDDDWANPSEPFDFEKAFALHSPSSLGCEAQPTAENPENSK